MHCQELGSESVSRNTLRSVWRSRWSKYIQFRSFGHGKRCDACARLDAQRTAATDPEEQLEIATLKQQHVDAVKADRLVSVRQNTITEQHAQHPTTDGFKQSIKITIDGMDQAKFKCPRNLANSSELEKLWRPVLHVTGCIVHGHLEAYFIMNPDQCKDANMECTILARVLDLVAQKLGPQFSVPQSLEVAADNTTREAVNQTVGSFLSNLVATEVFEDTALERLQPNHTHNEMDQRFSSVATTLSRAPVLEDREEFADWMREHVKPVGTRTLHIEVLEGTWDFHTWLHGLDVHLCGLAPTCWEPDVNHSWRFVTRNDIDQILPAESDIECHHPKWAELMTEHGSPSDVVLCLKRFMHSSSLSQTPLVVLPSVVAKELSPNTLKALMHTFWIEKFFMFDS